MWSELSVVGNKGDINKMIKNFKLCEDECGVKYGTHDYI